MAKTIIQTIGPLYGEVVNGTVFGRPNGSVYVPSTNTISLAFSGKIYQNDAGYVLGTVNARIVAQAQDLASVIKVQVYSDSDLTDLVAGRYYNAGQFNITSLNFGKLEVGQSITTDATYYIVAYLDNNSDHVATSAPVEVVGQ